MASMYDYLRVFLVLCIFIAALFRGPRTWIKVQAIGTVLLGVPTLLFPGFVLTRLLSGIKPDGLHLLLTQAMALVALTFVLFYGLASSSKDKMVFSSLLWSSVASCGMAAYLTSTTHFRDTSKFTDTHLYFLVLGCCTLFALNAWQLFRYWDRLRGSFHHTRANVCLLFDSSITFVGFVLDFCLTPKSLAMLSHKTNYFHAYILRLAATTNLGAAIVMGMGVWFSSTRDKQALFKCRIAMSATWFLIMLIAKLVGYLPPMTWEDIGIFATAGVPALFGALGLFFTSPAGIKFTSGDRGHYYLRDRKE